MNLLSVPQNPRKSKIPRKKTIFLHFYLQLRFKIIFFLCLLLCPHLSGSCGPLISSAVEQRWPRLHSSLLEDLHRSVPWFKGRALPLKSTGQATMPCSVFLHHEMTTPHATISRKFPLTNDKEINIHKDFGKKKVYHLLIYNSKGEK